MIFALIVVGCSHRAPPALPVDDVTEPAAAQTTGLHTNQQLAVPDLRSLGCTDTLCLAVAGSSLLHVELHALHALPVAQVPAGVILAPTGPTEPWTLVHECDGGLCTATVNPQSGALGADASIATAAPAFPADIHTLATRWNDMIAHGYRSPFQTRIPCPSGGVVAYLRGLQPTGAQLMRTGPTPKVAPGPGSNEPISYTGWLALHPTGKEAYILLWPDGGLRAFDPDRLTERWRLPLRSGAHGLFVDAGGRYLVAAQGGAIDNERVTDFEPMAVALPGDPTSDAELALRQRPDASETIIIDLAEHHIAAAIPGSFVAWVPFPNQETLIATTSTIALVSPEPARRDPASGP